MALTGSRPVSASAATERRSPDAARSAPSHGNDLDATIVAFTLALGHHALELGQCQVNHPSIARAHGLEGDDLAVAHRLLTEAARHAGQRVLPPAAITVGVDAHVTAV